MRGLGRVPNGHGRERWGRHRGSAQRNARATNHRGFYAGSRACGGGWGLFPPQAGARGAAHVELLEQDLDGGEHDGAVGVLEARRDALGDRLGVARVLGDVPGEGVQDEHLAPLRALVQRRQKLQQSLGGDLHVFQRDGDKSVVSWGRESRAREHWDVVVAAGCAGRGEVAGGCPRLEDVRAAGGVRNLGEGGDGVGDDLRVASKHGAGSSECRRDGAVCFATRSTGLNRHAVPQADPQGASRAEPRWQG